MLGYRDARRLESPWLGRWRGGEGRGRALLLRRAAASDMCRRVRIMRVLVLVLPSMSRCSRRRLHSRGEWDSALSINISRSSDACDGVLMKFDQERAPKRKIEVQRSALA